MIGRQFEADADWSMDRPLVNGSSAMRQPQLDIFETDKAYKLSVELPGVNRDDIEAGRGRRSDIKGG